MIMNSPKRKRLTVKLKSPNPLFVKWLTEWRDEARAKESKMESCFTTALSSLNKYPLPLESGRDCKVLKGFGDKLCKMLDDKLNKHKLTGENINLETEIVSVVNEHKPTKSKNKLTNKNNLSTHEYVPQYRSGGYAIMISLYNLSLEPNYPGYSHKADIIKNGQHLSDSSFTKPIPGTRYTAWSSMKTLLNNNLIIKSSHPPKFSLSDEGILLAHKLLTFNNKSETQTSSDTLNFAIGDQQLQKKQPSTDFDFVVNSKYSSLLTLDFEGISKLNEIPTENKSRNLSENIPSCSSAKENSTGAILKSNSTKSVSQTTTKSSKSLLRKASSKTKSSLKSTESASDCPEETIFVPAHTFDIVLLVDTQETAGKAKQYEDPIIAELTQLNVNFEVRHLKVGDYTWVCRDRSNGFELVLPYIVERKRMDDLGSSIKDGRFHEQKFRLKQCGIENIIYLVESYGKNNQHLGLPLSTIYQAATNTLVQDGFTVKFTENLTRTAEYLVCLTSLLKNNFENKTLMSCPKDNLVKNSLEDDLISLMVFKEFNKSASKTKKFKVKDFFIKQLLQIKGLSVDKAVAIVEKYPTPKLLKLAYEESSQSQGEKLLSSITFGKLNKNIGPVLSKIVYQLFNKDQF